MKNFKQAWRLIDSRISESTGVLLRQLHSELDIYRLHIYEFSVTLNLQYFQYINGSSLPNYLNKNYM